MAARLALALLLAGAVACASGQQFSTTLHGAPTEVIEPGTPGAATLTLQPWLTLYDPDAVCNDGTPAGYYFNPGTNAAHWLVYLEGGYWCWDKESCTERYATDHFDMSSSGWKSEFAQEGIFGTDASINPFSDFNMVFVKYCSSDSWFGDAPASNKTFGFAFRGARIVNGVMTALQQLHGLGSSGEQEYLLLGGCSAGGRGVLTNLDGVRDAAPENVRVRGLLDAAGWVDVQPIIPGMLSLQEMTLDIFQFAQAPIPPACEAAYPGVDAWKCVWPSYRLPFVTTEYFLNAAQFDAFQIMYDTNNLDSEYCCTTPEQQEWVDQFQTATRTLLRGIPSVCATYSSTCLVHCLSSNADWTSFTVDGISLSTAVARWYFDSDDVSDISECDGWNCTLACSGGPWEPTNTRCQTSTNVCANTYMAPPGAGNVSAAEAAEMGSQIWASQQVTENKAASTAAGTAAWNKQQEIAREDGTDPYVASGVPEAQATQAGNEAWAEQQAAANAAAAKTSGNIAWAQAHPSEAGPYSAGEAKEATAVGPATGSVAPSAAALSPEQQASLAAFSAQTREAPPPPAARSRLRRDRGD